MQPGLTISRSVFLKNHPTHSESWLQRQIVKNQNLLGLGDLMVHWVDRKQPTGGRVDLIFKDEDTRYQSKNSNGALDNSQIVRTALLNIRRWNTSSSPKVRSHRSDSRRGRHQPVPEGHYALGQLDPADSHPNQRLPGRRHLYPSRHSQR